MFKRIIAGTVGLALAAGAAIGLAGCSTDANVAAYNLDRSAESFELNRRIVFINGITDEYLLTIEGRCSIETGESYVDGALEVVCKVAEGQYKKHFLGLSDNVSFLVEQLEPAPVDVYHYRVIFKPESLVPSIDLQTSLND